MMVTLWILLEDVNKGDGAAEGGVARDGSGNAVWALGRGCGDHQAMGASGAHVM